MIARTAQTDPKLRAVLSELRPLAGVGGEFVRAASAVRRWQNCLAIVQDDTRTLALLGPDRNTWDYIAISDTATSRSGAAASSPWDARADSAPVPAPRAAPVTLQRAAAGHADPKKVKLDLEAAVVLPNDTLIVFGSGSTSRRERIVVVKPDRTAITRPASEFYGMLREHREFSGSELNLEGSVIVGSGLRLFQRGNGAIRGALRPVNATCQVDWREFYAWLEGGGSLPTIENVEQFDLGSAAGVPFGFTDAALAGDGSVAVLLCAEASADAVADGEVLGVRFGRIESDRVRVTDIVDEQGRPVKLKLEGLEAHQGRSDLFDVVADLDSPDQPALMGTLRISA